MTLALNVRDRRRMGRLVMTEKEFAAWDLRENHDMSLRRISLMLGIGLSTVRDRLVRADKKIRHAIALEFVLGGAAPDLAPLGELDLGVEVTKALLAQRDGAKCYLCLRAGTLDELVIEHVIARSVGGSDDPENLALACADCNPRKGAQAVSMVVSSGRPMYHPV